MHFIRDMRRFGVRSALWNARFRLGYSIGGFTSAKRDW
jgi:hypothetical protein